MPINILMPALSPTMEEGTLAKWLVKEGDEVSSGDVIAEIETDKATMEVEAVDEGRIGKIFVGEGTADVKVNAVIAVLLEEGEDTDSIGDTPPSDASAESGAPRSLTADAQEALAQPEGYGREMKGAAGSDSDGADVPKSVAPPDGANGAAKGSHPAEEDKAGKGERIFASPLARRMAADADVPLDAIKGSGPHGRVVKRDVEDAIANGVTASAKSDGKSDGKSDAGDAAKGAAAAAPGKDPTPASAGAAPKPAPAGPSDAAIRKMFPEGSFQEVPNDGMRKTIARRLTESKQTVPHFYLSADCRLDALLDMRKQLNAAAPEVDGKPAYKLSVNDFVIKAMALALKKVPGANASWTEAATLVHSHADVGVAVAVENGLFTPIIRRAEEKTLSTISAEMKDFAKRARDRKLKPDEYQGGTTSISNLGMFGIKNFQAIINPPHGTILSVGAGERRPVVEGDAVVVATVMSVTLCCDHRVVDGALGAELLSAFRGFVEAPMSMLV